MKCRRAFDADLAAVLRGEASDADFLAHYPACPECAAEVQVWRELDGMLRAGAPADAAHPDPEALLAFADAPSTLAAAVRRDIEQHLAACRLCTDELRTLARFDPATLAAAAPASAVAPVPRAAVTAASGPDVSDDAPGSGGWLARMVWHPAFAYALVAVLLVPLLRDQLWRIPTVSRVMEAEHEERRQAPGSAAPVLGTAPAPAPVAPPPPPQELADKKEKLAQLEDRFVAAAQGPTESKERVAAADADARKDVAPVKRMAPVQAAPADTGGTGLHRRERQLDEAAAPADAARLGREGLRQPDIDIAAEPEAAFASRARGAVVPGAAPKPETDVAANLSAKTAAGGAGGAIVEVRASAPTVIPFAVAEGGVQLRMDRPEEFDDGAINVSVRGRHIGGRMISTHVADGANAIELRIPPRWLTPGDYDVNLSQVGNATHGTSNDGIFLHLIVSAPTPPAAGR